MRATLKMQSHGVFHPALFAVMVYLNVNNKPEYNHK
jgi:hypothetical protein